MSPDITYPTKLATEINDAGNLNLAKDDFNNLVVSLQSCMSHKNMDRATQVFKALPRDELITRITTISKLYSLLLNIKVNSRDL